MFFKAFIILSVLKLTIGSSECSESNVRVDVLREQCPYHDHYNDKTADVSDIKVNGKEQNSNGKLGWDVLMDDQKLSDENDQINKKYIFSQIDSGKRDGNFKIGKSVILEKVFNNINLVKTSESEHQNSQSEFKSDKFGTLTDSRDSHLNFESSQEMSTSENVKKSYEDTTKLIPEDSTLVGLIVNNSNVQTKPTHETEVLLITSNSSDSTDGSRSYEFSYSPHIENKSVDDSEAQGLVIFDNSPTFNKRVSHNTDFSFNSEQNLLESCEECDLRLLPIQPSDHQESKFKNNKEVFNLPTATIQFSELPEGEKLQIESFGLTEGLFVFSYLGEFISYIQPNEFPVGLLQSALQNQISLVSLITESLQLEVGFVVVLAIGIILALAVPCVILSHTCYRMRNSKQMNRSSEPSDMANTEDIVIGWAGNCRRRTLVFILQLLLLLLIAGMLVMFVTNEQLSSAMNQSSKVLLTALGDLKTFLHNSHLQLHFVVTRSLDQALQACYADLDNVGTLLGRPIQDELIRQTGLDVALASLAELPEGKNLDKKTAVAAKQVEAILSEAQSLQDVLIKSRDKLADLRHQVDMFRRQCPPRDRALCDTINASGLDIILRLDRIRGDERLNRIKQLGGTDLTTAVQDARNHFDSVPLKVESDTRDARQVVRRQLTRQRTILDEDVRTLEQFTRNLASKVNDAKWHLANWFHNLDEVEFWRWIVSGSAAISVLLIWILLLSGISCGCCGSEKSVGPTLLGSIVLICLVSTALWAIALVGFLIGGHGEVFVCRPLYNDPQYSALTRLLDEPGVFYRDSKHGFFSNVVYGNDSIDLSIRDILKECRNNKPAYQTFHLHRVFDVDAASDPRKWETLRQTMSEIRVDVSHLQLLTPALNNQLYDLLAILNVNFTANRIQLSGSVTGKDLNSFANQLDSVGNQIRDPATASKMESLATRTRRLVTNDIQPLEEKRDALIYLLTALEVQVSPLERKTNQSLTHLKTIRFFINSRGDEIGDKKTDEYVERLNSYIYQFREHVLEMAQEKVAPCKPIWTIFHSTRLLFCKHIMDPLNGFWFATMWCLVVFLVATPVCLKLVDYYRLKGKSHSRSSGSPSESLMVADHGRGWSTPGEAGDAGTW